VSIYTVVKCEGHREGMPCRAGFPRKGLGAGWYVEAVAEDHGWRFLEEITLCPSLGHDEEPQQ
jgi:hypothetical protein